MISDIRLTLENQTTPVTADEATTDYIDFTPLTDPDKGTYAKVVEMIYTIKIAGTGAGTVDFQLQDDTDSGFATALRTLASSGAIVGSTLVKGQQIRLRLPAEHKQYVRGYVDVTGTVGAFTYECVINHLV